MNLITRADRFVPISVAAASVAAMIVALWAQGRLWWCKSGDLAPYINDAWNSSHTSQHLFDPYTFTHVLHGVLFFWLITLAFSRLTGAWQTAIAVCLECAWEVLENSSFVIDKYRENTASLDYFGDSIMNSAGDVAACALGFAIAAALGRQRSLLFFIAVELILLFWIRDGLLLNIVMLIYPLESIKQWQMG